MPARVRSERTSLSNCANAARTKGWRASEPALVDDPHVLEGHPTSQLIALVACGVGLFLGIAWWNAHTARKLQNEIDGLDAS